MHCFNLLQMPRTCHALLPVGINSTTHRLPFRGILLQARMSRGDITPVGTFLDPSASPGSSLKLLQCINPGDGITHSGKNNNNLIAGEIEVTWMPPNSTVGEIYFV